MKYVHVSSLLHACLFSHNREKWLQNPSIRIIIYIVSSANMGQKGVLALSPGAPLMHRMYQELCITPAARNSIQNWNAE